MLHEYLLNFYQTSSSIFMKTWMSFISNFGGKPKKSQTDHLISYKTILFAFFLDGMIIWICYRAFLTSELSSKLIKYPFNDLNSLAQSDYKYALYNYILI